MPESVGQYLIMVLIYIFLMCITFWIIGSVSGNGEKNPSSIDWDVPMSAALVTFPEEKDLAT